MTICGIDEAGRGPIAGPVTAAAVILGNHFPVHLLNDSKKLSAGRRAYCEKIILEQADAVGIGWVSHLVIDRINILQASLLAMQKAFAGMVRTLQRISDERSCGFDVSAAPSQHAASLLHDMQEAYFIVYADGNHAPNLMLENTRVTAESVIKGDSLVPEIMAASIIAKTARDRWMLKASEKYPHWAFEKHKGYPTAQHKSLCREYGLSPIHRKSFRIF